MHPQLERAVLSSSAGSIARLPSWRRVLEPSSTVRLLRCHHGLPPRQSHARSHSTGVGMSPPEKPAVATRGRSHVRLERSAQTAAHTAQSNGYGSETEQPPERPRRNQRSVTFVEQGCRLMSGVDLIKISAHVAVLCLFHIRF